MQDSNSLTACVLNLVYASAALRMPDVPVSLA